MRITEALNFMRRMRLMIEPTNRCNLRCPTCFSHQDGRVKKDLSLADFVTLIKRNAPYISHVSLYNYGEPLLHKNIGGMIRAAKVAGIQHVKLATNGMLLTAQRCRMLVASGLDDISISLDGAATETYAQFRVGGNFDLVVKNIKRLVLVRDKCESRLMIELQFIIMEANEQELAAVEALARKLRVDRLRFKTLLVKKEAWKSLLPENAAYSRYRSVVRSQVCVKPQEELVINADGTVIPCCYVVGQDVSSFSLGNIRSMSIPEIMASSAYRTFVTHCRGDKGKNSCCRDCQEGNYDLDFKVIQMRQRRS